ncbi:cysteine proteinase [Trichocladium antarcticum]|uniref:Cysteine proteinase n=1 Tax=Trichocladium antarcticum TaxID=1450529 RepID=A0AAN6UIN6_9PEZI|nr:cysteine proteinase [Trichocladium antarcticum]
MTASRPEEPDSPPKNLHIGAINPFALAEAILGRKLDWNCAATGRMLSSVLQTDYEELFDMRFKSILYAGIRLNDREDMAVPIPVRGMHTLTESDMVTPDFSRVQKLGDMGDMGLEDLASIRVKHAIMSNGNLRLTLEPRSVGKTLCSSEMTTTFRELATPFRVNAKEEWTAPNSTWTDISGCCRQDATMFSNPVQGATGNSWLVAALMSVAWSDPSAIQHCRRRRDRDCDRHRHHDKSGDCSLSIKLHSKGGDHDARTSIVTVDCTLPTNNSSSLLMYCRPSSMNHMHTPSLQAWGGEIWPALYEKAFAAWLTDCGTQHPDLTQTCYGDPIKALGQLTGKTPLYFLTAHRTSQDLLGLVRTHCVNLRTVFPMAAYTHPTSGRGARFRGCTLVGNMAYSVLGWAAPQECKQYLVLRHPWGVTEADAAAGCPGLVAAVDEGFWPPAGLVDCRGVFAMETGAFREYFAGMGVAK